MTQAEILMQLLLKHPGKKWMISDLDKALIVPKNKSRGYIDAARAAGHNIKNVGPCTFQLQAHKEGNNMHNGAHELATAFEAVLTSAVEKAVGPAVQKSIEPFNRTFQRQTR